MESKLLSLRGVGACSDMAIEVKQKKFGVVDRALLLAAATLQRWTPSAYETQTNWIECSI